MVEIESIEIINNNPEIIEDKPIEIIDRRRIKKIKKVEEDIPPVEKLIKEQLKEHLGEPQH